MAWKGPGYTTVSHRCTFHPHVLTALPLLCHNNGSLGVLSQPSKKTWIHTAPPHGFCQPSCHQEGETAASFHVRLRELVKFGNVYIFSGIKSKLLVDMQYTTEIHNLSWVSSAISSFLGILSTNRELPFQEKPAQSWVDGLDSWILHWSTFTDTTASLSSCIWIICKS